MLRLTRLGLVCVCAPHRVFTMFSSPNGLPELDDSHKRGTPLILHVKISLLVMGSTSLGVPAFESHTESQ